jgi:hypothetical protein
MPFFPESIMPSRLKAEAEDVEGNEFIVSASDHNLHDEEIRAIEKSLGVPSLPIGGVDQPVNPCSVQQALESIVARLHTIRDDYVFPISGVVAITDPDVVGIDRIIPFPSSWTTTLESNELDDPSVSDEDEEALLPSPVTQITLASTAGLPAEGYITIINDVSMSDTPVIRTTELAIYSSPKANGKVGVPFVYEVLVTSAETPTVTANGLPAGLSVDGVLITGTPETDGTFVVSLTATVGAKSASLDITVRIAADSPPEITNENLSVFGTVGAPFSYDIAIDGIPATVQAAPLPSGLTVFGQTITGTPREAGATVVIITVNDEFGEAGTASLTITIS